MSERIDISVVIPVYNAEALIRRCLDSILAQRGGYSYEVLLVDDGSTDDSVAVIESYNNPCFRVFRQQNAGPAAARNRGIENANGRYITFIDADDYWEDSFFEKTIKFLENHQECVAVSVAQKHLTLNRSYTIPVCISDYSESVVIEDFFDFWATWTHVCTGSMVSRSNVIKSIGGQRTDLRITEDWEYWMLIAIKGKWGFIPKILFVSDGGKNTETHGWVEKMEIRWKNSPTIAQWQKRIASVCPNITNLDSYKKVQGVVSRDLTYNMLLGGKIEESRHEAILYGRYFTKDKLGILMNICKGSLCLWRIMSRILTYREYHRKM